MRKLLFILLSALLVTGCLDSGGSSGSDSGSGLQLADVAGIWQITVQDDEGDDYTFPMLITSNGKVIMNDLDEVIYGNASVSGGTLTLDVDFCCYDDISVKMTAAAHATSMTLKTTYQGDTYEWHAARDQDLVDLYKNGGGLAAIAGAYGEDPDYPGEFGGEASLTLAGVFSFESDFSGCTVTGAVSTINPVFNEYAVTLDASECNFFDYTTYTGYGFQYVNDNDEEGLFFTVTHSSGNEVIWMIGLKLVD